MAADANGEPKSADEFWIFGYGSLIWKPPPHFDRRVPGWVTGYVRRFWQASQDHRGTPSAPGRVVTLIERSFWASLADAHDSAPEEVWGIAYRIEPSKVAEVKEYLDIREINGYTIHYTPFQPAEPGTAPIRTLVYIGTPDNEQFVGPQDPQALAEHIRVSAGPSGPNRDYLLALDDALAALLVSGSSPDGGRPGGHGDGDGDVRDAHVADLAARVRALDGQIERGELDVRDLEARVWGRHEREPSPHPIAKVSSVEEQEETEKA
ncbi:ChaC-domain-containing protein [Xylariaceae sp. FL0804]|nr:ChaC-domain-containing protein [Xylariaceae sp. FL0804]